MKKIILILLIILMITYINVSATSQYFCEKCNGYSSCLDVEPPSCTESGYRLLMCSHEIIIPAPGHDFREYNKNATCTEDGKKGGEYCSRCGLATKNPTIIRAEGHDYEVSPTPLSYCSSVRFYQNKCNKCGDVYYIEKSITPIHPPYTIEIREAVPPTCTETGLTEGSYCNSCHTFATPQEIVPTTGHTPYIDKEVPPTCTKSGLTEGSHCAVCNEVLVKQEIIPANHTESENWSVMKKADCSEDGMKVKTCEDCHTVLKAKAIKATGHTIKTVGKKSATYFAKGYSGDEVCKDCGEVISKGKATPKLKLKTPKATVKGSKKKLTVKYKKVKDATGFQVKYKIGKKSITKTYSTKKTATKTIKNLKKGTYKVYVRAFIKQGKNKSYSNWTKAKRIKIK